MIYVSRPARGHELGQNDITVDARFWADSRRFDFVATASTVRRAIVTADGETGNGLPDANLRVVLIEPESIAEDKDRPVAPFR